METLFRILVTWLVAFAAWILISALIALPTAFVWNRLMPGIFDLPEIGFAQAFGLLILSSLLFSSRKIDIQMNAD